MFTEIKNLFIFGLYKDTLFSNFLFVIMNLIGIWSICSLTLFISNNKIDIILSLIQLICYLIFMMSSYQRMKNNEETERLIKLMRKCKENGGVC